jgi:hypothetical protein
VASKIEEVISAEKPATAAACLSRLRAVAASYRKSVFKRQQPEKRGYSLVIDMKVKTSVAISEPDMPDDLNSGMYLA